MSTWFITGASRGIGAALARNVLAAGHNVVATARDPQAITDALGTHERLLAVALDVTDDAAITAAVTAAATRFGGIDVLVNNAGYGHLGLFEESASEDVHVQFETNVFGLMQVTRAVLPVMRAQRSGRIFNISSIGGIRGVAAASIYCASKFAVEGFSQGLAEEVKDFGIEICVVGPGYFRTDFLDPSSVRFSGHGIEDYAALSEQLRRFYQDRNHQQAGDPDLLAQALLTLAVEPVLPARYTAGSDAFEFGGQVFADAQATLAQWETLSRSTDGAYAPA